MSWLGDVFSSEVDAIPFFDRPSWLGGRNDNDQSIHGGRTEANRGVWWRGANGHYYTNDGARGVVDRGTNYSPPGGYTQIADPNPPKSGSGTDGSLPASNTTGLSGGFGAAAAPKVLDEAQLRSLDSLLKNLSTMFGDSKARIAKTRDANKREKEREKEREEREYKGKKLSTLQEFGTAKTDTDINTRDTLEGLVSALSTMGLGGSRALTRKILAAANISNRKANATQATNNQGLDTAWNDYFGGYEDDLNKIDDQYGYEIGKAEQDYLEGRQNLLHKKADVYNAADRTDDRTRLMREADSLNPRIAAASFKDPKYTGEAREMATPDLADYTQDIAQYSTEGIGTAPVNGLTPVGADGTTAPGNLAVRAIAVNDRDLGVKKKTEGELAYGV